MISEKIRNKARSIEATAKQLQNLKEGSPYKPLQLVILMQLELDEIKKELDVKPDDLM